MRFLNTARLDGRGDRGPAIVAHGRFAALVALLWVHAATAQAGLPTTLVGQSPSNTVPQSTPINYDLELNSPWGGDIAPTLDSGVTVLVDGAVVQRDSGEFATTSCAVDRQLRNYWACGDLVGGQRLRVRFTWAKPRSGSHRVTFRVRCSYLTPASGQDSTHCDNDTQVTVSTVVANAPPAVTIDAPSSSVQIKAGQSVNFSATARDPDGDTLSYSWNFGGGAPSSSQEDPGAVTFNTEGTYQVQLTVRDESGATATDRVTVTVEDPAVCGDGTTDPGEDCDRGANSGDSDSCCTANCTYRASGRTCRAANGECDVAETCTGSSASCPSNDFADASQVCRAKNGACDVAETCTGSSASCPSNDFADAGQVCRAKNGACDVAETCTGSSASCPRNGFASTRQVCREKNGACDVAETCTGSGASCPSNDFAKAGQVCREKDGACDAAEKCTGNSASCPTNGYASNGTSCDDDDACTTADTCNASGTCRSGGPRNCDDGRFCNGEETCDSSDGCQAGTPPSLSDGTDCTSGSCDEDDDRVIQTPDDSECDDGLFCNGQEACDPDVGCVDGSPPTLSDGVDCTSGSCDEDADRVVQEPDDAVCDNGDYCDGEERCDLGDGCVSGTPPDLSDGVGCTDDTCDEASGTAVHTPNDESCDNNLWCDGSETCDSEMDCQSGTPPSEDDGVPCTDMRCDEESDTIQQVANDGNCDNDRRCDGLETCDPVTDCQPGEPDKCSDGDKEVGDSCAEGDQCRTGYCADGFCCASTCDGLCLACSGELTGGEDGDCAPILPGEDPSDECDDDGETSCGHDGYCDGAGACAFHPEGTSCAADLCQMAALADAPDTCDGRGRCVERGRVPCMDGYACVGFACKESCDTDADCVATHHCVDMACAPDLPRGEACTVSGHCQSNHCVDGVCCDSSCQGGCRGCSTEVKGSGADGICEPVMVDTDMDNDCDTDGRACGATGRCDGVGGCQRFAGTAQPCGETDCMDGEVSGDLCDGEGGCGMSMAACGAYHCDGDVCALTCMEGADCTDGAFCTAASTCALRLPAGSSCSAENECVMDSGCDDGTCTELADTSRCLDESTLMRDSRGDVDAGPITDVDPSTSVMRDSEREAPAAMASTSCYPYRCRDAACLESCIEDEDCVLGRQCESGACVEVSVMPEGSKGSDCGCRVPGHRTGGPRSLAWLLVALLLIARARRR